MRKRFQASGPPEHESTCAQTNTEKKRNSQYRDDTYLLRHVFAFSLVFRVVNSLLIRTYFNPDEHWQALEVAHRMVFGYGHLTWEWRRGLRGYLHPLLFSFLYKGLQITGLDVPWCMTRMPRMLQSLFAAVGDLYLYKLALALFGGTVAKWALFSQLVNWFVFFCLDRTLSNSLEAVLTLVGLYYWPGMRPGGNAASTSRKIGLTVAAFSCAIRPTSFITWIYVGLLELSRARDRHRFLLEVLSIGMLMLGFTCTLDRLMHGYWVLVPLNFFKFNFLSSGGNRYGTHAWHWYISQGFPVMLFTFFPFSVAGVMNSRGGGHISGLVCWVLAVYSLMAHKEFRFVFPVLPLALIHSGFSLATMERHESQARNRGRGALRTAVTFLLVTNIPMALYMSLVHQRGAEDVMIYLSQEAKMKREITSILFLTPCHSTPYYSTLHSNVTMRILDCSPPQSPGVVSESDRFLMDPVGFVSDLAIDWRTNTPPSHIVLFDTEEKKIRDLLASCSFIEAKRFFHAHFKVDRDLQASVVLYASARSTLDAHVTE